MIAAVKVRGSVDASKKVSRTLDNLKLRKKNQCVLYEESDAIEGMLNVAKDYIAYGEIDEDTVEKLEEKKGDEIENGDVISLTPPSGGYRSTKRQVGQGGSPGKRGDMDDLLDSMV
ncbi:MAG: uL30 family ribosomal protein [Candidatus Nanohaloarchaea archaeon]